jgi:hypothetical protein
LRHFSREQSYEEGFDPIPLWKQLRPLLFKKSISARMARFQQKRDKKKKLPPF